MNPEMSDAKTLDELLKKVTFFGYAPLHSEMYLIQSLLLELKAYREGGVTEEILRRNGGFIKVGRGCIIARETPSDNRVDATPPTVSTTDDLKRLQLQLKSAIKITESGDLVPMTERERIQYAGMFGVFDFVVGDFAIKRL